MERRRLYPLSVSSLSSVHKRAKGKLPDAARWKGRRVQAVQHHPTMFSGRSTRREATGEHGVCQCGPVVKEQTMVQGHAWSSVRLRQQPVLSPKWIAAVAPGSTTVLLVGEWDPAGNRVEHMLTTGICCAMCGGILYQGPGALGKRCVRCVENGVGRSCSHVAVSCNRWTSLLSSCTTKGSKRRVLSRVKRAVKLARVNFWAHVKSEQGHLWVRVLIPHLGQCDLLVGLIHPDSVP
jgi:hypothetical protein